MKRSAIAIAGIVVSLGSAARAEESVEAPVETPPPPAIAPFEPKPHRSSSSVISALGPRILIRSDAEWAQRELFRLDTRGADFGVGIGIRGAHWAVWGSPRLFVGSTPNGLHVWAARVSAEAEVIMWRVRLGAGVGPIVLGVGRRFRDESLVSWGLEGRIMGRVDVWTVGRVTLFVRGALDLAFEIYDGSAFRGPSVGLGFELPFGR